MIFWDKKSQTFMIPIYNTISIAFLPTRNLCVEKYKTIAAPKLPCFTLHPCHQLLVQGATSSNEICSAQKLTAPHSITAYSQFDVKNCPSDNELNTSNNKVWFFPWILLDSDSKFHKSHGREEICLQAVVKRE